MGTSLLLRGAATLLLLGALACSSRAELVEPPQAAPASQEAVQAPQEAQAVQAPQEAQAAQAPAQEEQPTPQAPGGAAKMIEGEVFSGRIHLRGGGPGESFPPKYVEGAAVIRTQAEYESFVGRIPTHEISMTNPAPESDDPLLKLPPVDFSKVMLLVAERDSMYVGPQLGAPKQDGGAWEVHVTFPDEGGAAMAARVYGVGTYHLKVVARFEGEVAFKLQRQPKKP
jgi:hypothetical protein